MKYISRDIEKMKPENDCNLSVKIYCMFIVGCAEHNECDDLLTHYFMFIIRLAILIGEVFSLLM